mmetsp:Transcript_4827/g.7669  ORF Transcript_4827/g.7669 Transcript_4827/m.7669 type:complete len:816 (-) Transcript_4827:121-2568(-)
MTFRYFVAVVTAGKENHVKISGKVTKGKLENGMDVRFDPSGAQGEVLKLELKGKEVQSVQGGKLADVYLLIRNRHSPEDGDTMLGIDDSGEVHTASFERLDAQKPQFGRMKTLKRKDYGQNALHFFKGNGDPPKFPPEVEDMFRSCEDNNDIEMLNIVTDLKYDINQPHPLELETLCHVAARNNHLELLKILIDFKADVNVGDSGGDTVLMHFIKCCDTIYTSSEGEILDALIEAKADVNSPSKKDFSRTPLITCILKDQFELAEYLIKKNADVSIESKLSENALTLGIENAPLEIIKQVLNNWPSPTHYLKICEDVLEIADTLNRPDVVKQLKGSKMMAMSKKIEEKQINDETKNILGELQAHMTIIQYQKARKRDGPLVSRELEKKMEKAKDFLAHNKKHRVEIQDSDAINQVELDVQQLRRAFIKADKDGDGMMTREETINMLKLCGMKEKEAKRNVEDFFRIADADNSGTISWEEFVEEYVRMQLAKAINDVHGYFHSVDKNGDGEIDRGEFMECLVHMFGSVEAERQFEHLFNSIDQNGDGKIELHELKDWYKIRAREIVRSRMVKKMMKKAGKAKVCKIELKATYLQLHKACEYGNLQMIKRCILKLKKAGPKSLKKYLNKKDENKNPLIFLTLWKEHHGCMEALLDAKADINAKNGRGNTILHSACSKKDYRVIEMLIMNGAKENIRNKKNQLCHEVLHPSGEVRLQKSFIAKIVKKRNNGEKLQEKLDLMPDNMQKQYKLIFDYIDEDKSGTISQKELLAYSDGTSVLKDFFVGSNDEITWETFRDSIWAHIERKAHHRKMKLERKQ